ncbi:MAG TPA: hypothetical protein VK811_00510 [Candidatus Acidoferrum sp.]|jgi:hypothetical protein|nr:hypothetical protein [Candidatus Acidoferrum sp.]
MAIRINLLAEAQAAEDLRRRDPVKRVIIIGVLVVAALLVWSSTLQLKVIIEDRNLSSVQFQIDTETNAYQMALSSNAKITQTKKKMSELQQLTNARVLQGNLMNALQKVTVDNVQLLRIKVIQGFIPHGGKTPSITERTSVQLDARDSSANPGDQVGKYKAALAAYPYFREMLNPTNNIALTDESPPETDADGKNFVLFTLECYFPDKTR